MAVLFKEALPKWLGFDTLHTVVSRPDVSAENILRVLPTGEGIELVRNQLLMLGANVIVLGGIIWFLRRWWRGEGKENTV